MGRTALGDGLKKYYKTKIEELEISTRDKQHNLRRLEAQRNELNTKGLPCAPAPVLQTCWGGYCQPCMHTHCSGAIFYID